MIFQIVQMAPGWVVDTIKKCYVNFLSLVSSKTHSNTWYTGQLEFADFIAKLSIIEHDMDISTESSNLAYLGSQE